MKLLLPILSLLVLHCSLSGHEDIFHLDPYEVSGRSNPLIGETSSSSEGIIHQVDLEYRPLLRTGEILETIPGFIATQHSGTGKGNQFFLRGFNLDHGTDFATFVDGMPVNLPTHGHGQGYTDINFVIPELVDSIEYSKGPYYAEIGDFASAGAGRISTVDSLERGMAVINVGEDNYLRGVFADSFKVGNGTLIAAVESQYYDGPWDAEENLNKFNTLVKFTVGEKDSRFRVKLMGYSASWDSADQIPLRSVQSGQIGRFGSLDDDLGGESARISLSTDYIRIREDSTTRASLYAIYYDLSLWSNFTYFLEDPVNGDEFEQVDERMIYGGSIVHSIHRGEALHTIGFQTRYDDIQKVGLFQTSARQRLATIREDAVGELSMGVFYENEIDWTPRLKSIIGIRADYFDFDVDSNLSENSGTEDASKVSPKASLVYSLNDETEFFLSGGYGFHSNDARGTTISVDPTDGVTPAEKVDALVKSFGAEVGARITWNEMLNTSLSVWHLELDSELLFVGDAGITEPSRPSKRYGLEIANYLTPVKGLTFDVDAAFSEAKFDDNDPSGDEIPGAIDVVVSTGVTAQSENGWIGSLRLRYFGERALVEDGSVKSDPSTVLNLRAGYKADDWSIFLDVLNLLDSTDDDITYFYESRLPGEAAGVEGLHFHPLEPRTLRVYFSRRF
ncbi:TonB-dependent receptor [Puniceicoccales bacterium CK1056]|uniref:TonB-dependent receptor n=1 Tax=Oceanipulchritudo coccoides TaxID=2706888 RepID=A0A6B2M1H6_9BACT|nr:TonB-dependent receptor [Oceanipulchritudo coccoides]NDV62861.1 TonB-dependent receptor [Oceanipulchritudo coccoides]